MRPARPGGEGLATLALLVVLVALHVVLFAHATLVTDSGRDLANAWAVGHGGPYPSYGPELFGRWQLGPVWFWLLALPLTLFGSITGAAVFVGVLAALKIPLAYLVGRRMLDARLGLIAALAMALPGWSSVGNLVIAHTSVVEAAMLATFWLALMAWQERRAGMATLACLMLVLALHAHPTALIAAPAVVLAMWRAVLLPRRWGWLGAGIVLFLLPFAPAVLAEMRSGWPQAAASLSYLGDTDVAARLARLPQVAWALLIGGAWFAGHFLLPAPAASLWWVVHAGVLMLAAFGAVRMLRVRADAGFEQVLAARNWLFAVAGGGVAAIVFIVLLRDATPTWMVYCLAPFGAFALALGGHGLLHGRRHAGAALLALSLAVLGINLALVQQRLALEDAGRVLLPGGNISHIATPRTHAPGYSPWLSVRQFDALARETCATPGRLALHGELAATFDFAQGVATRLHCSSGQLPRLGGVDADHHLAGVSTGLAIELGFHAEPQRFGHVLREPARVFASERGRDIDVDVRYRLARQTELDAQGDAELSGHLVCQPGELLAITNLAPILNRFSREVRHGQDLRAPLRQTRDTAYYPCDGSLLDWRVGTPDPASVDVFVISLREG